MSPTAPAAAAATTHPEGGGARYLLPYLVHRAAARYARAWRAELGPDGPTIPRWQVLAILAAGDGRRLGELARLAGLEQPVASRVVDQMERDGLVTRRPAAGDRRGVEVWTTAAGRAAYAGLVPRAMELVDWSVRDLSDRQVEELAALLERLVAAIDDAGDDAGDEESRDPEEEP